MKQVQVTVILLMIGLATGCSGGQQTTDQAATSTDPNIPAYLQGIENLKVYPAETSSTHDIEFIEELSIGPMFPTNRPPAAGPLVAVDQRGYIYHGNRRENRIDVYNPEGELEETLGRTGQGPGEFTDITWVTAGAGIVAGLNLQQSLAHLYSGRSFSLEYTIQFDPVKWQSFEEIRSIGGPVLVQIVSDSTFIGRFQLTSDSGRGHGFYMMKDTGEIISDQMMQIPEIERTQYDLSDWPYEFLPESNVSLMYNRKPLVDFSLDDRLVYAWSEEFIIKVFDLSGNEISTIYYPYQKRVLSIDDEGLLPSYTADLFMDYIPEKDLPTTWPALHDLFIDDQNRIWVSTITTDDETYQWWVLDPEGALISRFDWPRNHQFIDMKGQNLYTLSTDPESDIQQINRYQFEMTEKLPLNN